MAGAIDMAQLADRESLSNAERRWALLEDSAWAIFNAAMTHRRKPDLKPVKSKDEIPAFLHALGDLSLGPEIPASVFSEAELQKFHAFHLVAVCDNWGLTVRQESPNIGAIEDFMGARFGYWSDDVPHADPFAMTEA